MTQSHGEGWGEDPYEKVLWLAKLQLGFGTVWWVAEEAWVWYSEDYAGADDRDGHPGVSLMLVRLRSYFERVPLLLGCTARSGETGPVLAMLRPNEPAHLTVFGTRLLPVQICVAEFDDRLGKAHVRRWIEKQELDAQEKQSLMAWYQRNVTP